MRYFLFLILTLSQPYLWAFSVTELDSLRLKSGAPAAGVLWLHQKKIDNWVGGVRKIDTPTPATAQDLFHLGSNTKSMTATLLATVMSEKHITWQTKIQDLFPSLPLHPQFKNITLEMISSHLSGITAAMNDGPLFPLWEQSWQSKNARETRQSVVEKILSMGPQTQPGSHFEYSNWNYIILGYIIETLTGLDWETAISERLFKPLQMTSCGFGPTTLQTNPPDQPWPHRRQSDGRITPLTINEPLDNPAVMGPAGTVHCSLSDWAQYLKLHLDGAAGQPTTLLSHEQIQQLHETLPGQNYTRGGWIRIETPQGPALQHTGSNNYNYANAWLFLSQNMAVAAVTNTGDESFGFNLTDSLISSVLRDAFKAP